MVKRTACRPPAVDRPHPDCRVEVVDGDAWIHADHSFELNVASRTTCGGEIINEDVRRAEGTVERTDDRLRFEARSGQFFGIATGSFTDAGHIDVTLLELEDQQVPVDWRFTR